MRVRRFIRAGTNEFRAFVGRARVLAKNRQPVPEVPVEILSNEEWSEPLEFELPDGEPQFADKLAIGEFCCRFIPETAHEQARNDAGMWTWLAARYFDQLTKDRQKIKEERAYVAGLTFQEFYRHLMLGPYYLYFAARENPERVRVLLYDEPTTMNEVMVQFGSYQTLMQNAALQEVVQRLYFDRERKRIKRGAGGKVNGAPRRLMDFFRQIELNYDLQSINVERFSAMLPKEFDRFSETRDAAPAP
jgi:hypothetical protein